MVLCPHCSEETPDGKRFCANCGQAITLRCVTCGAELIAGKPFCAECGTRVDGEVARAAPPASSETAPSAERRLCSILFVDLVGFTTFAEHRDAERVRDILTHYFERAQQVVDAYGGIVEKFIGDAVMAVWGAPVANEDDAERAVRAGLDIVDAVAALSSELSVPELKARAGVVTGEAAITIGRVAEGMVLGDSVNTASRIQSAAEPGQVLVDEATWRASSEAISFADAGTLQLKGKSDTVHVWRAERVVAQRRGLGRTSRLEPPFVGRDDEIRLIKDLLHATARERRVRLLSVIGVPGIGKSRLAWEFLKYVDGLAETVYWHQGRSRSYGEGVAFGALSEMVRMRAQIVETDDAATSAAKLHDALELHVTDDTEREWIEPRMAFLLGLSGDAPGDRDETFAAWRAFFEAVARSGPTVMVFEDLQWADSGLIDFIETLVTWSKTVPILVLTLARPEITSHRAGWGSGVRNFTSLHLDPLARDAMGELLLGIAPQLPADVVTRVLDRAEGIPLYAVETVRMLIDTGALGTDGTVTTEIARLEIPETLHALVASRIDSLPTSLRATLQNAGIVGSTFTADAVAVVAGQSVDEVREALDDLTRRELLLVDNDPRSPERGQFGFVQAVIREVAVGMMARRDRSAKHLALARRLEAEGDADLAGQVAAQYVEARASAPDDSDTDELDDAVCRSASVAGARALALGSPAEAHRILDAALTYASTPSRRAPLLLDLGQTLSHEGQRAESLNAMLSAADLYLEMGDLPGEVAAISRLTDLTEIVQDFQRVRDRIFQTWSRLGEDDDTLRGPVAYALAGVLAFTDRRESLAWSEIALAHAERYDDEVMLLRSLGFRAAAVFEIGRHREAQILARGVLDIAERRGHRREQIIARTQLSLALLPDSPSESLSLSAENAELALKAGISTAFVVNMLNRAETAIELGLWDTAEETIASIGDNMIPSRVAWRDSLLNLVRVFRDEPNAREQFEVAMNQSDSDEMERRDPASVSTIKCTNAKALHAWGQFERAYREAIAGVEVSPTGINAAACLTAAVHSACRLRNLDYLRQTLKYSEPLRGRLMGALRTQINAAIDGLEGREDAASRGFLSAIEQWRALGDLFDVALTELDLVAILGADHADAKSVKEAIDIFEQLRATTFLAQVEPYRSSL